PEYLKNHKYERDKKSNIYSLGFLLWEITSGKPPFLHLEGANLLYQIFRGIKEIPVEGTPERYTELYKRCWDNDLNNRPDILEVLNVLMEMLKEEGELIQPPAVLPEGTLTEETLTEEALVEEALIEEALIEEALIEEGILTEETDEPKNCTVHDKAHIKLCSRSGPNFKDLCMIGNFENDHRCKYLHRYYEAAILEERNDHFYFSVEDYEVFKVTKNQDLPSHSFAD
ncbi:14037_t:CDS:2, partial [Cetraspora pellucida]